jgi:hypothetical protein
VSLAAAIFISDIVFPYNVLDDFGQIRRACGDDMPSVIQTASAS